MLFSDTRFLPFSSVALQCGSDIMILILALNRVRLETVLADSDVGDILIDAVLVDSYVGHARCCLQLYAC